MNNETDYYKGTEWNKNIDGKMVKITIQEVEDYLNKNNIPIIDIPLEDVYHLCSCKDKKDDETLKRSEESNLEYPIIISRYSGKYKMVLDGHHRMLKANNNNIDKIKARILDLTKAPYNYQKMFS